MKLFKQKHRVTRTDDFYIVAKDKEEATKVFEDSAKEILDYLSEDAIPMPVTDVEEVRELAYEEETAIKDVIWDKTGLRAFALSKGLKKLRDAIV